MICIVHSIKPDMEAPNTFHICYGSIDESVAGTMMLPASSYDDAKEKFFKYTRGEWSGYNWPHNRL